MNLTHKEALQARDINQMLIQHLDNHVYQGLELAIYVFKWPTKYLRVLNHKDIPVKQLILDSPGLRRVLVEIELRPNPVDPMTVDTYIRGDIAEFMTYNMIKEVKPNDSKL